MASWSSEMRSSSSRSGTDSICREVASISGRLSRKPWSEKRRKKRDSMSFLKRSSMWRRVSSNIRIRRNDSFSRSSSTTRWNGLVVRSVWMDLSGKKKTTHDRLSGKKFQISLIWSMRARSISCRSSRRYYICILQGFLYNATIKKR